MATTARNGEGDLTDILAINGDAPGAHVVVTVEQLSEGRLAGAGRLTVPILRPGRISKLIPDKVRLSPAQVG